MFAKNYLARLDKAFDAESLEYKGKECILGKLWERISHFLIKLGGTFPYIALHDSSSTPASNTINDELVLPRITQQVNCPHHKDFINAVALLENSEALSNEKRVMLIPNKTQASVDFADARNRFYQMTIGKEHTINGDGILKLVQAAKANASNPLKLYLVTPARNQMKEKQRYTWESNVSDNDKKLVQDSVQQFKILMCFNKHLDQVKSMLSGLHIDDQFKISGIESLDTKLNIPLACPKCNQTFSYKGFHDNHVAVCTGPIKAKKAKKKKAK